MENGNFLEKDSVYIKCTNVFSGISNEAITVKDVASVPTYAKHAGVNRASDLSDRDTTCCRWCNHT